MAASRRLAELRPHAAADANFFLARAHGWLKIGQTIRFPSLVAACWRGRFMVAARAARFTAAWTACRSMCACFFSGHRLVHHFHKMSYFMNHAACLRGVLALHDVMHAAQTETLDGGAHIVSTRNSADHPLDLDGAALFRLGVLANDELLAEMMPAGLLHRLAVTNLLACYFFAH